MKKIIELLKSLGLTDNESKIYLELLKNGTQTASSVSSNTQIHRRNVYDALAKMTKKGFVFEAVNSVGTIYKPCDPDQIVELAQIIVHKANSVVGELNKIQQNNVATETKQMILKGAIGFHTYLQKVSENESELLSFNTFENMYCGEFQKYFEYFVTKNRMNQFQVRALFVSKVKDYSAIQKQNSFLVAKTQPEQLDSDNSIEVFGNNIVSFLNVESWQELDHFEVIWMSNHALADTYRKQFEWMWGNI